MEENRNISVEEYLELNKRINEVYHQNFLEYNNRLTLVQSTKAWKMMCLSRRINEQLLKGNSIEKKKFLQWVSLKLRKKEIPENLKLEQFSPINIQSVEQFNLPDYEITSDTVVGASNNNQLFKEYPVNIDLFRFPVIEWDFRWQRPQQISVQFQKNQHRVFYFSIDTNGIQNVAPTPQEIANATQIRELQENIYWVKLCTVQPLNAYKDKIEGEDLAVILKSLDYLKNKFNINATYSIIDLPFWSNLALALKNNMVIYDCMDDHEGFSTNSSEMLSNEEKLILSSDIVLASSQRLYEKLINKNENTLLVRNAGEYDHFATRPSKLAEEVSVLKGPVIGYYGAISEWFDIKLIEQLAIRNPKWTFVLVGNTFGCDISKAEKLPNVIFTGEKPYKDLPSYLHSFDICLIPFIKNNLTLATNPVKVYEYLAAGKPVISTKLPELEYMKEQVYLAEDVKQFEECIKESLNENNDKLVEQRQSYAETHTWEARYHEINNYLIEKFPKVSIVIVTYNNWSYTQQCLKSILTNNEYPNLEIIVVDNKSTDETRVQLAKIQHPNIKVLFSPENLGFAGGNKAGCNLSTGDYIILLNNDTIVTPNWVENLIKPLKENDNLGMTGPVSNSVGNDQMLDFFIGNPITGASEKWLEDFCEFNKGKYRKTELLGFYCVAIKREVYEKAGDLDTNFGIGMFEDDDYCEKVKSLGYELAIVEDVFIYHHGSVSFKKLQTDHYKKIWDKNKFYFENKWKKKWTMPKPPNTLFLNAADSKQVAEVVQKTTLNPVIVVGKWSETNQELKDIVKNQVNAGNLVFVLTSKYNQEEFHGLRKVTDHLYITKFSNILRDVLFEEAYIMDEEFDINVLSIKNVVKI